MRFILPGKVRSRRSSLRKHRPTPALHSHQPTILPTRSKSGDEGPGPILITSRLKSYTSKNEVNLCPFPPLSTDPPVRITLLPATLLRQDRGSFTTLSRSKIRRSCQSFVRKMCHPRALPAPKSRLTRTTLNNGARRRSLPDIGNVTWD